MKIKQTILDKARSHAWNQGGVITATQADAMGISETVRRRLVREGTWRPLVRGIYGVGPDTWMQRAWAGVLIGGAQSCLGSQSALFLHGFAKETLPIVVYMEAEKRTQRTDYWRFIRSFRQGAGSPARTTLSAAIIDVGESYQTNDLVHLLGSALTSGKITDAKLLQELESRVYHRQRRLLTELIHEVSAGTTSALEHRYLKNVEQPHGLPTPQRQVSPLKRYRVDIWYEEFRLIIELDGKAYHQGLAATIDMQRDNFHQEAGITTLRFTWSHVVRDPCTTAHTIARNLKRAGWTGRFRRCPHCHGLPVETLRS